MVGGENRTRDDGMDGEEWTERGAGALRGAGVKCAVERRPLWGGGASNQVCASGGIEGDSELWDPCDCRGGSRDSPARGGKSCWFRMSNLFPSWMSLLGDV